MTNLIKFNQELENAILKLQANGVEVIPEDDFFYTVKETCKNGCVRHEVIGRTIIAMAERL